MNSAEFSRGTPFCSLKIRRNDEIEWNPQLIATSVIFFQGQRATGMHDKCAVHLHNGRRYRLQIV